MAQIVQTLLQLVVIQNQNQPQQQARERAPRRREVVESESEPYSQDEALEEESK